MLAEVAESNLYRFICSLSLMGKEKVNSYEIIDNSPSGDKKPQLYHYG